MSDTIEPNKLNEPFVGVKEEDYDGREFVHDDNAANVGAYVGVDPIYQNYANEGEDDSEDDDEVEGAEAKKATTASAPKAPVPAQRTATRAASKDDKSGDTKK